MTSILVVTFWSLNIVIWKLFVIWCLLFGIWTILVLVIWDLNYFGACDLRIICMLIFREQRTTDNGQLTSHASNCHLLRILFNPCL